MVPYLFLQLVNYNFADLDDLRGFLRKSKTSPDIDPKSEVLGHNCGVFWRVGRTCENVCFDRE